MAAFHLPYLGFTSTPSFLAASTINLLTSSDACSGETPSAIRSEVSLSIINLTLIYGSRLEAARFELASALGNSASPPTCATISVLRVAISALVKLIYESEAI